MLARVLIVIAATCAVVALATCAGAIPGWGRSGTERITDPGAGGTPAPPSADNDDNSGGGNPPPPPGGGAGDDDPPPDAEDDGYAADTLYIYPELGTSAVGEPVTVLVVTGRPAHPLQFLSCVSVTIDAAGSYVEDSFNIGAPGGARTAADGMWGEMGVPDGQFLDLGDALLPGAGTDLGNGRHAYDFAVVTMGPFSATDAAGVLFNFELTFNQPGTYRLGLREKNGPFDTLYYSDGDGTNYFWGATLVDEAGQLNPDLAGYSNVIVVE